MSGSLKSLLGRPTRELRRQRRARLRQARRLRWRHRFKRLQRAILAAIAIFLGSLVVAHFSGGIGMGGFFLTIFAMIAAFALLAIYPRTRRLTGGKIPVEDLTALADQTQGWLETQRRLLPGKTRIVVDILGSRLAELSPRLDTLPSNDPVAHELRKLLGEHLPALIDSYTCIPAALTNQPHAGSTPAEQLHDGLVTVAREIETIGNAVARGELDALAIRGRYLETRYEASSADDSD